MQNYKKIIIACVVLLALAGGWYIFAGRNDVHDIRDRANTVRNELADAAESQRAEAEVTDRAADAVERSSEAVEDSGRTAAEIQGIERSDAEIIRACQSIIERVRERGQAQSAGED